MNQETQTLVKQVCDVILLFNANGPKVCFVSRSSHRFNLDRREKKSIVSGRRNITDQKTQTNHL
jgi:hypothetical protein